MPKILSKRGQISMEIGILVAAAVAVAAIVAYYYISSVKNSMQNVGQTAHSITQTMIRGTENYTQRISELFG